MLETKKGDTLSPPKGYKKTKLGWIPEEWTTKKVSQVFDFLSTNSFSRNQMNYEEKKDSIYNIHYGDIHATYTEPILDLEKCKDVPVINEDVVIPNSVSFLKDGDLVMADASEDYAGVGETVELAHLKNKRVLAGLHTFALRDKSDATVKGFRTYIFKHPKVATSVKVIATGSKVYGISKTNLANVKVILPPLPEQQKIATILSTWDKAIDKLTQLIAAKEQRKKGLMQVLLTGKKRFVGFKDKWNLKSFRDLAVINQGLQIPISERYINKIEGSYFYITNEFLKSNSNYSYYILNPSPSVLCNEEDILMTRTGNTGTVVTNVSGAFHNNFFKIKYDKTQLNKDFLFFKLISPKTQYRIRKLAGSSTIPDLNHSDFYRIKIEFPHLEEQQKIASVLSAADKEIELLKNELESLQQQKKGLMQVLLTGALRVS